MGDSADEQTDPRFLVGQVLAGRYWLQEHLGRGAMGDVFRARHAKVPRTFAVKVLHPELVEDEKTCRRFEREAELAGRLHHRNVVSVIDVGETARSRYLVMEFAEGISLVDVIAGKPLSTSRVLNLSKQICDGLQHAHEHELIHRDLKPENIIVERTGDDEVPRIVDFGLAILRDGATAEELERLTTRGIVLGTPHYLAPETALGEQLDHRIDLFALGVVMYEMMTGVMPFDGDGVQVAQHNLRSPTPAMGVRAPGLVVDPLLEALVGKLLEKNPADRPQTAREVRSLLELIETDREKASFVLGVKAAPATQPLPAGLRSPKLEVQVGAADAPPLASGDAPPLADALPIDEKAERLDAARQRDVITDRVRQREPRTTDELLRASGARRRGRKLALGALVLLVAIVLLVLVRRGGDDDEVAPPVAMTVEPPAPAPAPTPAPIVTPAPGPVTVVADVPAPPPPAPRKQPVQARVRAEPTAAVPAVTPEAAAPPPRAEDVLALYQSLGRELKAIADRRDMSADDLWVRYRRVRIQDVMTDSAKRADALTTLLGIDKELAKRFRGSSM